MEIRAKKIFLSHIAGCGLSARYKKSSCAPKWKSWGGISIVDGEERKVKIKVGILENIIPIHLRPFLELGD
jgi:hypothetical protein